MPLGLDAQTTGVSLLTATRVPCLFAQGCEEEIKRQVRRGIDEWLEDRGEERSP